MNSIRFKLTLVVVAICVLAVALVGMSARYITSSQFDRLRIDQAEAAFVEAVGDYYQLRGSWNGVAAYVEETLLSLGTRRERYRPNPVRVRDQQGGEPGDGLEGPPFPLPNGDGAASGSSAAPASPRPPWHSPFALAATDGKVLVPAGPYQVGDVLSPRSMRGGEPVRVGDRVVGVVSNLGQVELRALERDFLRRTGITLLYVVLVVAALAVAIGMIASSMLLRPIRDITAAIRKMRAGNLAQSVPVRTRDEFGEMAIAFNAMSAEVARGTSLREQMTADIAHELRTPVSVITGYLEGMREGVLSPNPATIETLHEEALHLRRLVEDLRTLSLADANALPLQVEDTALGELLQGVAGAFQAMAAQEGVALEVTVEPPGARLRLDPSRMRQVLSNLVTNALRHTPRGGRVELRGQQDAAGTTLLVRDTGGGIEPEALPYVFDRFYRADAARSDDQGSSGLGLAIARSLVEAQGGELLADSVLGRGTTMTVHMPAHASGER